MAFRSRGRGRGGYGRGRGGGGDFFHGKPEPYVLFPEDVQFPTFPTKVSDRENKLVIKKWHLEKFWKDSCYNLEDAFSKSNDKNREIQRYSDRLKENRKRDREDLSSYLKQIPSNFPSELIQGCKRSQSSQKKLRWDKYAAGNDRLDLLEKRESSGTAMDDEEKEKKGDDDDDDDERLEEEDQTDSDDGDYNQNRDFDDDEDDLNIEEEPDEDTYE